MEREYRRRVRRRARNIKKANKAELTTKDYIQRALVVMLIVLILAAAMFVYNKMR